MAKKKINLKAELKKRCAENLELARKLDQVLNTTHEIRTALWGSHSYKFADKDIVPTIEKMIKAANESTGSRVAVDAALMQENSKLWYLVRSLVKDETLKNDEANHRDSMYGPGPRSPFEKPQF